jgi:tRNA dimethylallyltransferase
VQDRSAGQEPRFVCLVGPTGVGKTEIALRIAESLPVEIISMDSAMVYRGMDIGTAKPDAAMRAAVPHHLIDIRDPGETYSAGQFRVDAFAAARATLARGRVPLVVGGTLLYLRALRHGLASLPQADPELRRALDEEAAKCGWPALHERLRAIDPEAASRIAPQDRQRIQRALEVHALTGQTISGLQRRRSVPAGAEVTTVALMPVDRARLAARLEKRFDQMVAAGFVAEVEALRAREELDRDAPALRAVGYRQVWAYLDGQCDWDETRRRAIVATRRLAKRQLTWLRGDEPDTRVAGVGAEAAETVLAHVRAAVASWS